MEVSVKKNSTIHANIVFRQAARTVELNTGDAIREAGLTQTQFGILDVLYVLGDMTINRIKEKTLATSGNMTVVLKNMERDGYITRKVCPNDKRSFEFSITALGRQKFEEVLPKHRQIIDEVFSIYTEAERQELIRLLKKFKQFN
ncbi:MarR family winged helix-turn-helix transcriptional regulator [Globicatella sanguinis]|uniref:MarR family winged helix-turn-helix transcriptional regulator n=1 Tax=Globicatella sanguinis TaxID=13076 RepID=UPI0008253101|nr:MarR family transcriptional regulator [Globicatella sanguinis]